MIQPFDDSDMIVYLEMARMLLHRSRLRDHFAEMLDLSDPEMVRLRDQLEHYMQLMDEGGVALPL